MSNVLQFPGPVQQDEQQQDEHDEPVLQPQVIRVHYVPEPAPEGVTALGWFVAIMFGIGCFTVTSILLKGVF